MTPPDQAPAPATPDPVGDVKTPAATPPGLPPTTLPPVVLLRDLTAQLHWPRLLRIPAEALWPSRLILGVLGVLVAGMIGSLSRIWSDGPTFTGTLLEGQAAAWSAAIGGAMTFDVGAIGAGIRRALIDAPWSLVRSHPVGSLVLAPHMIAACVAAGGAIARSVAEEQATDRRPGAARMLGWSLARCPSAFLALAGPLALVWLLVLLIRCLGWIGLAPPVVDIAGALLFPVLVVMAVACLALALGIGLGGVMIVPARMAEDSDAFDAAQRSLAYAAARPLRLALYMAVAMATCAVAFGAARLLIVGGWALAAEQAAAWLGPDRAAAFTGTMPPGLEGEARSLPPTTRAAHWIIGLWGQFPALLVGGYAVSLFFTSGMRVYLAMRQVCDGQDPCEIQGVRRASDS